MAKETITLEHTKIIALKSVILITRAMRINTYSNKSKMKFTVFYN